MYKFLSSIIGVGLSAFVLTSSADAYTVKSDDTIGKISEKENVSIETIQMLNPHITDINEIFVGEEIALTEDEVGTINITLRDGKSNQETYLVPQYNHHVELDETINNDNTEVENDYTQPQPQPQKQHEPIIEKQEVKKEVKQEKIQPQHQHQVQKTQTDHQDNKQSLKSKLPKDSGMDWHRLAMLESGGNPSANTGNGYYGLYQFDLQTWRSVGGKGLPSDASAEEQTVRAQKLYEQRGTSPWPSY